MLLACFHFLSCIWKLESDSSVTGPPLMCMGSQCPTPVRSPWQNHPGVSQPQDLMPSLGGAEPPPPSRRQPMAMGDATPLAPADPGAVLQKSPGFQNMCDISVLQDVFFLTLEGRAELAPRWGTSSNQPETKRSLLRNVLGGRVLGTAEEEGAPLPPPIKGPPSAPFPLILSCRRWRV